MKWIHRLYGFPLVILCFTLTGTLTFFTGGELDNVPVWIVKFYDSIMDRCEFDE